MSEVTRPVVRWFGGKWKLAPWIIGHFPAHRIFVEPFGGGGSVLMRKARSYAEVYNDLDVQIVNLFRVLRDQATADELRTALRLTPFARDEFAAAAEFNLEASPVEKARALVIRSFMGFGSNAHSYEKEPRFQGTSRAQRYRSTGFRANSNRSGTTPAHDWQNYPEAMEAMVERLRGVIVENRDALECMTQHDSPLTLHYVDPPYVFATRGDARGGRMYTHEYGDADHVALLGFLKGLAGYVILSGYPTQLYDAALAGWRRVEREAHADGARDRTEVLWINPAAVEALEHGPLFAAAS